MPCRQRRGLHKRSLGSLRCVRRALEPDLQRRSSFPNQTESAIEQSDYDYDFQVTVRCHDLSRFKVCDDETWESKSERGRGGRRCVLQRRACEPIRTKISSQRSMHEILNNAEYTRVDIIKFFKERVSVMHTSSRNAHCTGGVYGGWSSRNLELISTLHCGLLQRRTCKPVRKNINSKKVMHEIPNHAEYVIVAHQYNVSKRMFGHAYLHSNCSMHGRCLWELEHPEFGIA